MLYAIISEDVANSLPLRKEARVVAEFASLEAAQQWADADPYIAAGVYAGVTVKPFKKVLP